MRQGGTWGDPGEAGQFGSPALNCPADEGMVSGETLGRHGGGTAHAAREGETGEPGGCGTALGRCEFFHS